MSETITNKTTSLRDKAEKSYEEEVEKYAIRSIKDWLNEIVKQNNVIKRAKERIEQAEEKISIIESNPTHWYTSQH